MEQRPNQSAGPWDVSGLMRAAGCAHVNAVYVQVQSGSKINAVGSDSGLISSGLSRVGFIFFKKNIYVRRFRVRSDSGSIQVRYGF